MGKIKKMITGVAITFLCGMAVFVSGNTCLATGESYNTATEAAYGDTFRSVYENRLARFSVRSRRSQRSGYRNRSSDAFP